MSDATLIIPTLERQAHVRSLVATLARQSTQSFEVVIVDQSDAEDAELAQVAANSRERIRVVRLARKSLPNARNVGAAEARSPILIYIDDDVELSTDFVASHLRAHAESDRPTAVAGRITGGYDDGDPDAESLGDFNPWLATVTRNFHLTKPARGLAQLPGGNFSVRRDAFHSVGGFDAEGFCGTASIGEETDFALRLVSAGYRIDFAPDAHLVHLHLPMGGCRDSSVTAWTYWHGHNMALLARRYSGPLRIPVFVVAQLLRYVAHGIRRRSFSVTIAGWRGTIRGLFRSAPPPPRAGGE